MPGPAVDERAWVPGMTMEVFGAGTTDLDQFAMFVVHAT
jgi:hypothetical protein